jgi:hypothetical protein
VRYGLVRLVAAAALVAGCGASSAPAWSFAPTATPAPPSVSTAAPPDLTTPPPSAVAPSASLSAATTAGFAHFDTAGIAFDYPAAWAISYPDFDMHYSRIVAFLGTGTATAACQSVGDNGQQCGPDIRVGPGQLMVEVANIFGPPKMSPIDPADPAPIADGGRYVTVAGLQAITGDGPAADLGVDVAIGWTLSKPGSVEGRYALDVRMRGPGLEAMRAQVDALVASLVYSPPVPVLDPADGPAVLAKAIKPIAESDPAYRCFPLEPGASTTAVVRQLPGLSPLRKDLPVTCSSAIEPTPLGLWKATLVIAWDKAADREAGKMGQIVWISPDGEAGTSVGMPGSSDTIPYWN